MTKYPIIVDLRNAIIKHKIRFKVLPPEEWLTKLFYRNIRIEFIDHQIDFPVSDEYEDVDADNPLVLLHLVLRTCVDFEEAEDFLVWTKDLGMDAADETVRSIYFDLREKVPAIRKVIGYAIKPVSHWDIEMNTGIIQALRSSSMEI